MADRGLTGILLVGGASRRFGSPKALASFGRETLAERAWRVLGECCDERLALGKREDPLELPFELLDDESDVRAPIAGVIAGLRRASHDLAVVLPVDSPLVRPGDLRVLADACADAAVPPTGPLPAAYRRSALPALERALADGRLALRDVLPELDVRTIDLPRDRLANANTPEELARLAEPRIVPLEPEHVCAFGRFVAEALGEFGFSPDATLDPDLAAPAQAYVAAWVVLDADDAIVGSVVLIERGGQELLLRRMYLAQSLRGRGLGRALLELAVGWAREHGYRRVRLDTTDAMVTARQLYERAGFREIGQGPPRGAHRRIEYELDLSE